MALPTYPQSDLDDRGAQLGALGSFWADVYQGSDLAGSFANARAQLDIQAAQDFQELLDSVSRLTCPPLHTLNYVPLRLLESEKNTTIRNFPRYNSVYAYGDNIRYGEPVSIEGFAWAAPADLARCRVIANRLTAPSVVLIEGLDFVIEDGTVTFRADPFANPAVIVEDVVDADSTDREVVLWMYRADFDLKNVYFQFGYALGLPSHPSPRYRDLVNAIYDGLVLGDEADVVDRVFEAIADAPLAIANGEIVRSVFADYRHRYVATDERLYRCGLGSTILVSVGDVLAAGQALTDAITIFDLNRGGAPEAVRALALGRGLLAEGYAQDLVFRGETTPLVVETDADGRTKVSFEIGGLPGDVEKFFDDAHTRGIEGGKTLAQYLDVRANPVGEPSAASLPATVNPLEFLIDNLFRFNLIIAIVKPGSFGDDALGTHFLSVLRRLIPPHRALIVLLELAVAEPPVILDGPGDDTVPGVAETWTAFISGEWTEEVDPEEFIVERVRFRSLAGRCI